jgi:hypothetical protein
VLYMLTSDGMWVVDWAHWHACYVCADLFDMADGLEGFRIGG